MKLKNKKISASRPRRIEHKKARFDYALTDEFEAGIVLAGDEVKAVRAGAVKLEGASVRIKQGQAWLLNATVGSSSGTRKLLLHKPEIVRLVSKTEKGNLSLVPVGMYFAHGWVKVKVALAKRKTRFDKRQAITKRDMARQTARGEM